MKNIQLNVKTLCEKRSFHFCQTTKLARLKALAEMLDLNYLVPSLPCDGYRYRNRYRYR